MHTLAGSGLFGFVPGSGPALEARLGGPTGVCADAAENVYFTDGGNSAAWRVSPVYNAVLPARAATGGLRVWPNPARDFITIALAGSSNVQLGIVNTLGSQVYTGVYDGGQQLIDVDQLPNGIYYIKAANDARIWSARFTVIH